MIVDLPVPQTYVGIPTRINTPLPDGHAIQGMTSWSATYQELLPSRPYVAVQTGGFEFGSASVSGGTIVGSFGDYTVIEHGGAPITVGFTPTNWWGVEWWGGLTAPAPGVYSLDAYPDWTVVEATEQTSAQADVVTARPTTAVVDGVVVPARPFVYDYFRDAQDELIPEDTAFYPDHPGWLSEPMMPGGIAWDHVLPQYAYIPYPTGNLAPYGYPGFWYLAGRYWQAHAAFQARLQVIEVATGASITDTAYDSGLGIMYPAIPGTIQSDRTDEMGTGWEQVTFPWPETAIAADPPTWEGLPPGGLFRVQPSSVNLPNYPRTGGVNTRYRMRQWWLLVEVEWGNPPGPWVVSAQSGWSTTPSSGGIGWRSEVRRGLRSG